MTELIKRHLIDRGQDVNLSVMPKREKFGFWNNKEMTDNQLVDIIDESTQIGTKCSDAMSLSLHHDLHTFLSKLDPDLCHYSGIRYKSELEDCGISVDGHTKGNGWKIRISWEQDTEVLWSPSLKALLDAALKFLKDRVKA